MWVSICSMMSRITKRIRTHDLCCGVAYIVNKNYDHKKIPQQAYGDNECVLWVVPYPITTSAIRPWITCADHNLSTWPRIQVIAIYTYAPLPRGKHIRTRKVDIYVSCNSRKSTGGCVNARVCLCVLRRLSDRPNLVCISAQQFHMKCY